MDGFVFEIDTKKLNISDENKYNKVQSKEIDKAIKQFNQELKNNNNLASNEILKNLGNSMLKLCVCIQKNHNGVYHKESKDKGLLAFSNDLICKLTNFNFNYLYNYHNEIQGGKETIKFQSNDKLEEIHSFLGNMRRYKTSGSRVNKLIDQCEKVLKVYAKKRLEEKQEITDSNKLIQKANTDLIDVCNILDKALGENKNFPSDVVKELKKDNKCNKTLKTCDEKLSDVYEILCCLAEMEGKMSSKSGKGLAGWYNKNRGLTNNKDIFNVILDISENYKDYVDRTGFLGMGKSRLSKLKENIDKLKNRKNENKQVMYLDLYIGAGN